MHPVCDLGPRGDRSPSNPPPACIPPQEHVRAGYAMLLHRTGFVARARRALADAAVVLMYHRVLPDEAVSRDIDPGMYVTRSTFERHLAYLTAHHELATLDQLREWLLGQRRFSRIPCVITFDDGWKDNYEVAFPLLERYGVPATIFLITAAVGSPEMVSWQQAREMETGGIQFGSHTVTHPVLTAVNDQAIHDELVRSKAHLARELRRPSHWFCYPKGAFDERSLAIAREHYIGAVSTEEQHVRLGDDLHHVHRIGVHNDISRTTSLFACRLALFV